MASGDDPEKLDSETGDIPAVMDSSSAMADAATAVAAADSGITNSWYWNAGPRARPSAYLRAYWCGSSPLSNPMTRELLFVILFAVLAVISPEYIFRVTVNERPIPYQNYTAAAMIFDLSATNELVEETVPAELSAVIATVIPTVLMVMLGFFLGPKYDAHSIWCAICVANGSAAFYVQLFKLYVGRLRPNFFMKCGYAVSQETLQANGGMGSLTEDELVRLADGECGVKEARVSFPSGHSTFAFAGCTMICLYLLGKIALQADLRSMPSTCITGIAKRSAEAKFRYPGVPTFPLWKKVACIISMAPMLLSTWIACSRLVDNYHHPADVVAGSLLGAGCAFFAYALWFPWVFSPWSGIPLMLLHEEVVAAGNTQ